MSEPIIEPVRERTRQKDGSWSKEYAAVRVTFPYSDKTFDAEKLEQFIEQLRTTYAVAVVHQRQSAKKTQKNCERGH